MPALGVDTGGTFTDLVLMEDGTFRVHKVPSTPGNPADALLKGAADLCPEYLLESLTHGTTVATNALLERRGARVALVTTAGFEDILEIGRQNRPSLYDFDVEKPRPLVQREDVYGVSERTLYDGTVERRPNDKEVKRIVEIIVSKGYEAAALCFLHSYSNPENEQIVASHLERAGIPVSVSHRVLPEYREYERFSTTAINAYVSPRMGSYLRSIDDRLPSPVRFRVMQSNGGSISAARAQEEAVQTIFSGPAGGVVGAFEIAHRAGFDRIITFDMGGTSTDVSLCDSGVSMRTRSVIAGCPVGIPVVDILTVGAGGGSIAWVDSAGSLHVGPQSAGADPGPVCYGRGAELAVSDANLCLGRLDAEHFLGGGLSLDVERTRQRMSAFAGELGLSADEAAEGILRIANATMERAIRVISVERGHDPRRFSLVAFGGAGPMHACDLARTLSIPTVIVPANAGVLSALGLLMADVARDFSQTVLARGAEISVDKLDSFFAPLEETAGRVMSDEGFPRDRIRLQRLVDLRYVGQSYEVTVPAGPEFVANFHSEHHRLYGHSDTSWQVELVNVRLAARGIVESPELEPAFQSSGIADSAFLYMKEVVFDGVKIEAPVFAREMLCPGNQFEGPAIVVEKSSTTVVSPDYRASIDEYANIIIMESHKH